MSVITAHETQTTEISLKGKKEINNSSQKESFSKNNGKAGKKRGRSPPPRPRKYTLLEKLLAPDIRKERNQVMQMVHYIVNNKFFEESKDEEAEAGSAQEDLEQKKETCFTDIVP